MAADAPEIYCRVRVSLRRLPRRERDPETPVAFGHWKDTSRRSFDAVLDLSNDLNPCTSVIARVT